MASSVEAGCLWGNMMITLKGRFKGEVDERWHIIPICDET